MILMRMGRNLLFPALVALHTSLPSPSLSLIFRSLPVISFLSVFLLLFLLRVPFSCSIHFSSLFFFFLLVWLHSLSSLFHTLHSGFFFLPLFIAHTSHAAFPFPFTLHFSFTFFSLSSPLLFNIYFFSYTFLLFFLFPSSLFSFHSFFSILLPLLSIFFLFPVSSSPFYTFLTASDFPLLLLFIYCFHVASFLSLSVSLSHIYHHLPVPSFLSISLHLPVSPFLPLHSFHIF